MESSTRRRLEHVLSWIEKGYPTLAKLECDLRELGIDLSEPLPKNGTLYTIEDYGRAVMGLAKFLMAIGQCLVDLQEKHDADLT